MRVASLWMAGALLAVAGCTGGQTGDVGAAECIEDAECVELAEGMRDRLEQPHDREVSYVGSECIRNDWPSPTECRCQAWVEGGSTGAYGAEWYLGHRDTCDIYGRSGDCTVPSDEFEGCDLDDPTSCEAGCRDAVQRVQEDWDRTFDVEIRTAFCESYYCYAVIRVDDRCHVRSPSPAGTVYDCSLSDEEILALDAEASAPPECSGSVCDGGAGVSMP